MDASSNKRTLFPGLMIAALGVVYGDIGTSPLYAFRICFGGDNGLSVTPQNVYGVLSLIFWSLVLLISLKYLSFVLKADNRGEGGILALLTLLIHRVGKSPIKTGFVVFLGLFGASLLYGDGLITPVISVLSAVEGLTIITPSFTKYIVPISLAILVTLFWFQKRGSGGIGSVFGPIMLFWFIVLAVLGIVSISKNPTVLSAINPYYAVSFFVSNKLQGFLTLGAVFLVLTGGEALYADMGHFGKVPIRKGWFFIVFPSLIINYFGQGAFLLNNPQCLDNLFYRLAPQGFVLPLVILATMATVIASQACISGAFSLARQSVQLGFCPRLAIFHTSKHTIGQVYVPFINWMLCIGSVILVLQFGHSDRLAAAYGVAVSTTMLITSVLLFLVMRQIWKWHIVPAFLVTLLFVCIDMAFFLANFIKVQDGGWISLLVAAGAYFLMYTWNSGRIALRSSIEQAAVSTTDFLKDVESYNPVRVKGTAVFLAGNPTGIPRTLLHNFKHNKIIHETVVCLTVTTEEYPYILENERVSIAALENGFYWIIAHYGFSETPDIPVLLNSIHDKGIDFDPMQVTYFLGRESLLVSEKGPLHPWQKGVFAFMSRNSYDASKFFHIPTNRVIEIGIQIEL